MSRTAPVPLKHEAITATLSDEIAAGRLMPGAQLPGEVALARRFGVSRTTIRAALAELIRGGLIATRRGKGSFVQPRSAPRAATPNSATTREERAVGALLGLAVGDALGMPTQLLSRAQVIAAHGPLLAGFEPAPPGHPIAAGMGAGQVTDDTEQAVILAGVLIDGGGLVDPHELANRLVAWEADMRARGSLDLLGPSTRRALADLLAGGDVETTGRSGDTNGAAMRITPVGIAVGPDTDAIVGAVEAASRVTHNTGIALAGASAVAAAVSAGVEGLGYDDAVAAALAAAAAGSQRGRWVAGADVASRIRWAVGLVAGLGDAEACDLVQRLVGTSLATQESVPAAFALWSLHPDDPWLTCRLGASVGGDCDTIAAMAGAMSGALVGRKGFPPAALAQLGAANPTLDLAGLAVGLLALRTGAR
ncbi:MAG TPA: ADP-ribosylglycohydrolase family protein [Propionicimonas sp.]|jgi:ADP-ribosylglycohydrolase|uniref:ADP-ribosylglycohydrolase family protein n=1 Tax=Propionicimonas sp. TaxID=1955623 RepID=UPI002F3F651B